MGQEIFYCSVCSQRIRTADVESGQAFMLENRRFCLTCGPEFLRTLPKDRAKEIFQSLTTPAKGTPVVPETVPRQSSARMRVPQQEASRSWIMPAAIGGGVVVVVIAVVVFLSSSPAPEQPPPAAPVRPVVRPAERPAPVPAPIPERKPDPTPAPAPPPPPSPPPSTDKEKVAREALQKAREWAAANPSDFDGAVRKFQDASFLATGTSCQTDANQDLERFRQKQRDFFAKEFSSVEQEVKAASTEERIGKALDLLRLAKERYPSAEWQLLVGKRVREVNDDAFRLFNRVKEEALDAQGRGDEEKVKTLRTRVVSWGVERFVQDLQKALGN